MRDCLLEAILIILPMCNRATRASHGSWVGGAFSHHGGRLGSFGGEGVRRACGALAEVFLRIFGGDLLGMSYGSSLKFKAQKMPENA